MAVLPDGLIVQAGKSKGAGYEWGANGPLTFDCSGYVRYVYAARNVPFPDGTRTAEQIRQYCAPVGWDDVQPGDLLFVDYEADRGEPQAADGHGPDCELAWALLGLDVAVVIQLPKKEGA